MDNQDAPGAPRLLVFPDRATAADTADVVLEQLTVEPRLVREALAGEDDAEDAQWLLVCDAPENGWTPRQLAALAAIAADHDGWIDVVD